MAYDRDETGMPRGDRRPDEATEYLASRRYDPGSSNELVNHIVETVAAAAGVEATELPRPLYDSIDPDAIEALYADFGSAAATRGHVSFEYEGYRVRVRSDGFVGVY